MYIILCLFGEDIVLSIIASETKCATRLGARFVCSALDDRNSNSAIILNVMRPSAVLWEVESDTVFIVVK